MKTSIKKHNVETGVQLPPWSLCETGLLALIDAETVCKRNMFK